MVAPSLSLTQFYPTFTGRTLANTIRTDLVTTGFDVSNDGARIAGTATNGNSNYIELLLDNPINATGIIFKVFMQTAYRTQNIQLGLGSGPDIYQLWQTPTDPRIFFRLHDLLIDVRQPPVYPAVGAFNITAVDRIRLNFDAISSATNANLIRFEGIPYYFDGDTEGVQLIDGDIGNPLSFAALYTALEAYNVFAIASRITPLNTFLGTNSMQFVAPVTMGNAGTTAVSQNPSTLIFSSTPNNANNNNIDNSTNLVESAFRARFSGLTAPDRTFQNLNMPFLWADEGGGNTWPRLVLIGPSTVNLGTSDYQGARIQAGSGLTSGGNNIVIEWLNSTAPTVYEWNGTANLAGSTFNSPASTYYIDIPASLGTVTLDVSDVNFTTRPTGDRVFRAAPGVGETVTIRAAASAAFTVAANVQNDGAGTVEILAPQVTLTIQGIPAGGIFTIWDDEDPDPQDLGTLLQETSPTTGADITYIGSSGNALILQFVPNTGDSAQYQEFNFPFTFPAASQNLDLSTQLELENSL